MDQETWNNVETMVMNLAKKNMIDAQAGFVTIMGQKVGDSLSAREEELAQQYNQAARSSAEPADDTDLGNVDLVVKA